MMAIRIEVQIAQSIIRIKMNVMGDMREGVTKTVTLMEIIKKEEGIHGLVNKLMLERTIPRSTIQGMTGVALHHEKVA
jgi:hypothetical protein